MKLRDPRGELGAQEMRQRMTAIGRHEIQACLLGMLRLKKDNNPNAEEQDYLQDSLSVRK